MAYRRRHRSTIGYIARFAGGSGTPAYYFIVAAMTAVIAAFFLVLWGGEKMAYDELLKICTEETEGSVVKIAGVNKSGATDALVRFTADGKSYTLHSGYSFTSKASGSAVPVHYCPKDPHSAYCYSAPIPPRSRYMRLWIIALVLAVISLVMGIVKKSQGVRSGGIIGGMDALNNYGSNGVTGLPDADDLNDARSMLGRGSESSGIVDYDELFKK